MPKANAKEVAITNGYVGKIAFHSWVLDKDFVDKGIDVHGTREGAAAETRNRMKSVGAGPPHIYGGWVEGVDQDGQAVSASRPDIEKL